ncbi:MAG: DUF512 domain-containing protein [Eubacteriales bacterium]|jgi:putative radical SAM enzyme (TIGR03279 family)
MRVTSVEPGSPAAAAGIRIGETLIAIGRHAAHDMLDYRFYTYDAAFTVTLRAPDGTERTLKIRKEEGEEFGLTFESYLGDRMKRCANNCVFCFVDQLPKGLRESLYIKDDDMRLSFLEGNYISMTNLTDDDLERMIRMRISPVNVSVQTTDPELRVKMLRNPRAGELWVQMEKLAAAHIRMNCQIVVCPGLNDGDALRKSLEDLLTLYPAVASISVVPVGITRFRDGLYPLTPVGAKEAAEILDMVQPFGERCVEKYGERVVYCADELFLRCGRPIPEAAYYDSYPQLENGVGLMAKFEDELRGIVRHTRPVEADRPFAIATGCAAAEFMRKMLDLAGKKCHNIKGIVYAIRNDFFGHTIDVAGLVTGTDLIAQLKDKPLGERLLIPATMLRQGENVFLDDVTPEQVAQALGIPVEPILPNARGLWDALRR